MLSVIDKVRFYKFANAKTLTINMKVTTDGTAFYLYVILGLQADDQSFGHFVVPLVANVAVVFVVDGVIRSTLSKRKNCDRLRRDI